MKASREDLESAPGVGRKAAESAAVFFSIEANRDVVSRMRALGLAPGSIEH